MIAKCIFLTAFILFFRISYSNAQMRSDTTGLYLIETRDGNQYIGEILEKDSGSITLRTENLGVINIKRIDILRISPITRERIIGKEYWFENPQATRYFWAPNGYGLKKGEGYYQNVWIFFNQFAVGVTDHFSIGGGFVPMFLFAGSPTPVWATPKVSIPVVRDKFNLGVGALAGTVIGESDLNYGIFYGITTFGSRDKNISIGLGYGFAGGEMADLPALNVSAMIRTGKRGYFLTENYIIPGSETTVVLSLGGRSMIQRVGLDYGLFIPIVEGMEGHIAIPWLGITIPFGK